MTIPATQPLPGSRVPTPQSIFPLPLDPTYPTAGEPWKVRGASWGSHQVFCIIQGEQGVRSSGQAVEDHGPECQSEIIGGRVRGVGRSGELDELHLDLVTPYLHGVYDPKEALTARNFENCVRVASSREDANDEFPAYEIFIPAGAARTFAAALTRAADRIDFPATY